MLKPEDFVIHKEYQEAGRASAVTCSTRPLSGRMLPLTFDTLSEEMRHVEIEQVRESWHAIYGDLQQQLIDLHQKLAHGSASALSYGEFYHQLTEMIESLEPPFRSPPCHG